MNLFPYSIKTHKSKKRSILSHRTSNSRILYFSSFFYFHTFFYFYSSLIVFFSILQYSNADYHFPSNVRLENLASRKLSSRQCVFFILSAGGHCGRFLKASILYGKYLHFSSLFSVILSRINFLATGWFFNFFQIIPIIK